MGDLIAAALRQSAVAGVERAQCALRALGDLDDVVDARAEVVDLHLVVDGARFYFPDRQRGLAALRNEAADAAILAGDRAGDEDVGAGGAVHLERQALVVGLHVAVHGHGHVAAPFGDHEQAVAVIALRGHAALAAVVADEDLGMAAFSHGVGIHAGFLRVHALRDEGGVPAGDGLHRGAACGTRHILGDHLRGALAVGKDIHGAAVAAGRGHIPDGHIGCAAEGLSVDAPGALRVARHGHVRRRAFARQGFHALLGLGGRVSVDRDVRLALGVRVYLHRVVFRGHAAHVGLDLAAVVCHDFNSGIFFRFRAVGGHFDL